jgi:hypothetical protein
MLFSNWFEGVAKEMTGDQLSVTRCNQMFVTVDELQDKFEECLRNGYVQPVADRDRLRMGFVYVGPKGENTVYMVRLSTIKGGFLKDKSRKDEFYAH